MNTSDRIFLIVQQALATALVGIGARSSGDAVVFMGVLMGVQYTAEFLVEKAKQK